jgi:2-polyprenyl-3-methyl-5-hydroxy-6-metoxy-1,4-benzoquinol methylase
MREFEFSQLRHILIRDTQYRQRGSNKTKWVEWQKYDSLDHISLMRKRNMSWSVLSKERLEIISNMVSRAGSSLKVLDVGCGDGVVGRVIENMGNFVTSVELPKIATAAHSCQVPSVVAGDAEQLGFAPNSFDLVLASEVMEHLWKPSSFLCEAYRVLKPNGYLIVETPEGREGLVFDAHRHFFTVEIFKHLFNGKFAILETKRLKPINTTIPTIIVLSRKINAS